jgi:hypothetical protein
VGIQRPVVSIIKLLMIQMCTQIGSSLSVGQEIIKYVYHYTCTGKHEIGPSVYECTEVGTQAKVSVTGTGGGPRARGSPWPL